MQLILLPAMIIILDAYIRIAAYRAVVGTIIKCKLTTLTVFRIHVRDAYLHIVTRVIQNVIYST